MASVSRTLLKRGYATAANVKAPIQLNSLTGTYATSTYLAALKKSSKELETLAKDITALETKIKEDPKVTQVLNNPTLSVDERHKFISSVVPSGSSPILTNLLEVLSSNGRLSSTPQVFSDFAQLMAAYRGELIITVTSADALASKEIQRLEKALKGTKIAEGKQIKLVNKVNPSVLGGLMVDFGEQTIDLTASSKVNKYGAVIAESI